MIYDFINLGVHIINIIKKRNLVLALFLILFFLIFNADLRVLIGAAVYWFLILGVVATALLIIRPRLNISKELLFLLSCMLAVSFFGLLSSLFNLDSEGAYQVSKITVSLLLVFLLIVIALKFDLNDLSNILMLTLILMNVSYFFGYISPSWLITLGDGRVGTQTSYPGVMWKAGAFILPIICASYFLGKTSKIKVYISMILATNIVLIDGSRTGFLYLSLQLPIIFKVFYHSSNNINVRYVKNLIMTCLFFIVSYVAVTSVNYSDLVVLNRLTGVDSSRLDMLSTSFDVINRCIIFGCGFGTSAIDVGIYKMVVHNAYLSMFGDFGFFSFISLVALLITPIALSFRLALISNKSEERLAMVSITLATCGFPILMLFHPLSSEFSEWGIYLIPLIALFSCMNTLKQENTRC